MFKTDHERVSLALNLNLTAINEPQLRKNLSVLCSLCFHPRGNWFVQNLSRCIVKVGLSFKISLDFNYGKLILYV